MKKVTCAALMGMIAVLLLALPVTAGRLWCAKDPIVNLNGQDVQIWVAVPEEYVYLVNGPVEVQVDVPLTVTRSVVLTDDGFNGYGEVVTFGDLLTDLVNPGGVFNTQITVQVPVDLTQALTDTGSAEIPVQVTVVNRDETIVVEGASNGVSVTTRVKGQR